MREPSAPLRMSLLDWSIFVLCAVLWGSAYTFNKLTIAEIPILTITGSRLLIAALILHSITIAWGQKLPWTIEAWRPFLVLTLFSNIFPFLLILYGQRETASGLTAILGATTPLFIIPLAHVFTHDEKMRSNKVAGVIVGLCGVAVVFGADAFAGWSSALVAKVAIVSAALLYAIGAIYSKRLVGHPPLTIATMQMTCGAAITLPAALLIDQPWTGPVPSGTAIAALLGTAMLGSALSPVLYFHVLRKGGATNAMLTTLLVPVTPILLGGLLFGEKLQARELLGTAIIGLALAIIDGRLLAWLAGLVDRQSERS